MKLNNSTEALDYIVKKSSFDGTWEVWTPDEVGGIIGLGKTEREAKLNAIACLGKTIDQLVRDL